MWCMNSSDSSKHEPNSLLDFEIARYILVPSAMPVEQREIVALEECAGRMLADSGVAILDMPGADSVPALYARFHNRLVWHASKPERTCTKAIWSNTATSKRDLPDVRRGFRHNRRASVICRCTGPEGRKPRRGSPQYELPKMNIYVSYPAGKFIDGRTKT